jgi:VanZ family protein
VAAVVPLPVCERSPTPFGGDKLLHGVAHAWLTWSLAAALEAEGIPRSVACGVGVVVSAGYGIEIERLQQYVPGRRYERGDVQASVVGSVIGVVVWSLTDPEPGSGGTVPTP